VHFAKPSSPLNGEGDQLNLNANGNVRMSPPPRVEDALSVRFLFEDFYRQISLGFSFCRI